MRSNDSGPIGKMPPAAGRELGLDFVTCHPRKGRHVERLVHTLELVAETSRAQSVLCLIEDLVANVHDLATGDASRDQSPPRRVLCRSA